MTCIKSEKYHVSPLVPLLSPQEIDEKNSKKIFLGYFYRSKSLIFGPKKFFKTFLAAFSTTSKFFFFKTKIVPGIEYGSSDKYLKVKNCDKNTVTKLDNLPIYPKNNTLSKDLLMV
jgi:hypothetical protein